MTRVKICGLTTLEDARHAWRAGADLLGFVLVPSSPRYVPPEALERITRALGEEGCSALRVGVFAGEGPEEVSRLAEACALDLVQLHGGACAPFLARLNRPAIVARRVAGRPPWEGSFPGAWAHLLDTYVPHRLGGTGRTWRWDLLAGAPAAASALRLIVAGGLTPENVRDAVRVARPWGVDVSTGVEAAPGRKDPVKVARFVAHVREEHTQP
jgi:phosphoribosylanthranilate isomerase